MMLRFMVGTWNEFIRNDSMHTLITQKSYSFVYNSDFFTKEGSCFSSVRTWLGGAVEMREPRPSAAAQ